jgi:hypothetical protein
MPWQAAGRMSDTIPTFLADAGTPLMWAGFAHLTVGNFFIGLLEAVIVRRCFAVRVGTKLFASIVLANYVSCIAGYLLISSLADRIIAWIGGSFPVYSIGRIMVFLAIASFIVSILIECPIFWFAMKRQGVGIPRSFNATLLANAASYLVLLGWYWLASATPARWGVNLVAAKELPPISNARVFYISPEGEDIMQTRLDGSTPARFCRLPSPAPYGVLGLAHEPTNNSWELEIDTDWEQPIQSVAQIGPGRATTRPTEYHYWMYHRADNLESPAKWSVWTGSWPWEGITVTNTIDGTGFPIMAVEMPWLGWLSCNATILPNDQLVFQLGEQIMRVDLKRKLAAAVAAGHGPVVVLDK